MLSVHPISIVPSLFPLCSVLLILSSTPSPTFASCQSSACNGTSTPTSSPLPFSAPPTPSYTPCCTPRRLSFSQAESSTNLRDSTKTTSTSLGLVRLLLERGISASVYDPCSWDRGLDASGASTPVGGPPVQQSSDTQGETEATRVGKRPNTLTLQPSTPPNSPHSKSASSVTTCPVFQFSPSNDEPPFYDTFLASKPARTILREVLGEAERERGGKMDDDSQADVLKLRLVDKLKCFRTLPAHTASVSPGTTLFASLGSTGLGNTSLSGGIPGLNAGLRRNRSYPAMVGASMAMKDPGGPPSTDILVPHTMQNPHLTANTQEVSKTRANPTLVSKAIYIPQTLHALETVTPQTIIQRHTRSKSEQQCSTSNDQHRDAEPGT